MTTAKTPSPLSVPIKSDEIFVDTSNAPWMDVAKKELDKKLVELSVNDTFLIWMRISQNAEAQWKAAEERIANFGSSSPSAANRFRLSTVDYGAKLLGTLEARHLAERNPRIVEYMKTVKTDPALDKKGRSWDVAPTYEEGGRGHITAWCAAFVNWCLIQAGAPHLGCARAAAWLNFGTPVAAPVYGCITVLKPSRSTGSTSGHVCFFVENVGDKVRVLGGNQNDKIGIDSYAASRVLGYRWPTSINHYLLATRGVIV